MTVPDRVWEELDPDGPPTLRWVRSPGAETVALLVGAFDPPTRAHLALAEAAAGSTHRAAAFCVTKILLDRPADELLGIPDRLRLLDVIAAERGYGLGLCNRGTYLEVRRAARVAGVDPVFVIGSDKLPKLEDPSFYADGGAGVEATFSECRFLVVSRGVPVARPGLEILGPEEVFDDASVARTSATDVRERVRRGEDVSDLVPPVVAETLRGYTGRTEPG